MCGVKRRRFIVLFGYKLNQFGLRKCPHDHWLANKACKQYHSDKNFSAFYLQDGGEKRRPWIRNKIESLSPHVYQCKRPHSFACLMFGIIGQTVLYRSLICSYILLSYMVARNKWINTPNKNQTNAIKIQTAKQTKRISATFDINKNKRFILVTFLLFKTFKKYYERCIIKTLLQL